MEAQIAALEEEVAILKGEIKSVLQEMRTAILASENPFSGGAMPRGAAPPALSEHAAQPRVIQLPSVPGAQGRSADEGGPGALEIDASVEAADEPEPYQPAAAQDGPARRVATAVRDQAPVPPSGRREQHPDAAEPTRMPVPDVRALAALLTWVEETRERLDDRRFRVVLGLARYGDLVDDELEKTLLEAAKAVGGVAAGARASTNDSIVALRQLEAILAPDSNVRRLRDFGMEARERDDYRRAAPFEGVSSGREARPSRRQ
jgi:hypothetical protein